MFDSLTEKLVTTLRTLSGKTRLSEETLDEVCRQLRTNLLEADVNVKVVKDFIESVRAKSLGKEVQRSISPEQHFIRIVYEELTHVMGGKATELNFRVRPPAVFMVVGLQGSGKTTSSVKLAKYIKDKFKKSVLAASMDVYRPAAIEQLAIQMQSLGIENFESSTTKSVRERAILAKEEAIRKNMDVLLVDTAGRLHIDNEMMDEVSELAQVFQPAEILLVIDGMTGQDAVKIASSFNERLALSGLILTKLDGDARGGAALSVRAVTGVPIKFVGIGEKSADFEVFHPDRLASRILDMGDLLSLAEKATTTLDPEETLKLATKAKKNDFTLADFYSHLQQIKKMGSFENLMKFLPGMGQMTKQFKDMAPPDTELKKIEAIIQSMTPNERVDHNLLDGSRRKRIAAGSGTKVEDINKLMKQFLEARKMMTRLTKMSLGKRNRMW
ncbi:MAG: signal recognition particle protein [Deltaproteobacteria bacterium]|nr:signal recognition particle protein [Deltaproteobacteria bacterium]